MFKLLVLSMRLLGFPVCCNVFARDERTKVLTLFWYILAGFSVACGVQLLVEGFDLSRQELFLYYLMFGGSSIGAIVLVFRRVLIERR